MAKKKQPKKAPVNYKTIAETETETKVQESLATYITGGAGILSILKYLGGHSVIQQGYIAIRSLQDYIDIIRKGIKRRSLDHLMDKTGITAEEMAAIMHTSDRTLRRYNADTILNTEQSERAFELARLYSRGEEVFGSPDLFKNWMNDTVLALGNKKPKDFLDTSLGIDVLMNELGRIEQGVFA